MTRDNSHSPRSQGFTKFSNYFGGWYCKTCGECEQKGHGLHCTDAPRLERASEHVGAAFLAAWDKQRERNIVALVKNRPRFDLNECEELGVSGIVPYVVLSEMERDVLVAIAERFFAEPQSEKPNGK